ncbi:sporulation membrane protein YtaF [Halothermothrix orenii]|uniref:Sporulation protein YtaF n=1 Tax=Halothermothrix orenii (strain H 168 / OCM 544 / DSM 9562) TaxID=373903 RepID=B8D219_HALOH|nr:sporulation membrane protein YtaF [Halothermothrix orenii]ACL69246.1 Sporulation protein YtaF [Halothermothrix orenii H 168]
MEFWTVCILAIAISVDGFSVGLTYGLRKIKFDLIPLLINSVISALAVYITGTLGNSLAGLIEQEMAETLGGIMLIIVGGWLVYSNIIDYNRNNSSPKKLIHKDSEGAQLVWSLNLKPLGIIINILREPVKADFDNSGSINQFEALMLGLALALDAVGAGLGAGLAGFFKPYISLIIGVMTLLFSGVGFYLGSLLDGMLPGKLEVMPGLVIMFLGFLRFF